MTSPLKNPSTISDNFDCGHALTIVADVLDIESDDDIFPLFEYDQGYCFGVNHEDKGKCFATIDLKGYVSLFACISSEKF